MSSFDVSVFSFSLLLNLLFFQFCTAIDVLTPSQALSQGQTLTSPGEVFELGFVSFNNSSLYYVGIWHKNIVPRRVLWVANREKPVTDSLSSSLMIAGDGNLKLMNGMQGIVWSTKVPIQSNDSVALLLDSGNFVLKDNSSGQILWECFSHPGDTFWPGMMIGMNVKTGEKRFLISSKSKDDPSPGSFVGGTGAHSMPIIEGFIWNGTRPYWRSGQWNGIKFLGMPRMSAVYTNGISIVSDSQEGSQYVTLNVFNTSLIKVVFLSPEGSLQIIFWDKEEKEWRVQGQEPESQCDIYGACGPNGICNKDESPICRCLAGFEPSSSQEWSRGNWTNGCVRRVELNCDKNISLIASSRNKTDGFLKLSGLKLPAHSQYLKFEVDTEACKLSCLNNCSCMAFASVTGIGCMLWTEDLMDVQAFSSTGEDLFVRVAHAELGKEKHKSKVIFPVAASCTFIVLSTLLVYGFFRYRANQKGESREALHESDFADAINPLRDTRKGIAGSNIIKQKDSLIFDFNHVVVATNNFSLTNKLGEGGFGPVYKGKLQNGKDIAVKRLSSHSGQGMEEFKNEIVFISKLQHRNLVRLLGCCVEGEEKLLIYEYMPNKSLDTFLFDATRKTQLVWAKRCSIIQGIARGLVYLHRDSFLRVIHRDLKASNVLLDEDMNPKISDFGLARTFQKTQELANTGRVVGTLGYMSPEYVIGGKFSEKSDVFSFGVLLLEIVSGEKNSGFLNDEHLNLLGYAWRLWCEGRVLNLIDQALGDSFCSVEVMRCIHVGLLCVQENPADRPNMPAVILQLTSGTNLPQPKQPAFAFDNSRYSSHRSNSNSYICSVNEDNAMHRPTMAAMVLMLQSETPMLPMPRQPTYTFMRSSIDAEFTMDGQEIASSNDVTVTMVVGR